MKKILLILSSVAILAACNNNAPVKHHNLINDHVYDSTGSTNNCFDNTPIKNLEVKKLYIGGEVADSGYVDFSKLQTYSMLIKETEFTDTVGAFIGAYKYIGYSLHDILSPFILKKKIEDDFSPNVDAYIEIENDKGEKVYISWGEIYYPNKRNNIIIASKVMNIVPVKSKDQWPLPESSKVIVFSDLYTERNISNPVRITVKSYPKHLWVRKGLKPLYSPSIMVYNENKPVDKLTALPKKFQTESVHNIFYGRGRGIHSTEPHTGIYLKEYLKQFFPVTKEAIQKGIIVVAAKDGYRAAFSYSEIMNRNDQSECLLMCFPEVTDEGIFRIYPSADFFSDRAIKGITDIYYSIKECN